MTAPLTLIVEGKPLVFDVPVPVGEVIPAGTWFAWQAHGRAGLEMIHFDQTCLDGSNYLTARPPVAPESFADGDVAWVRAERPPGSLAWRIPSGEGFAYDVDIRDWINDGDAFSLPSPRPESLADVLDDLGLTDEQRARVEKAVGA